MTNQIQGETLYKGWTGQSADQWVYTPWTPVHGDIATFAVEVVATTGLTLTWNVETRTKESSSVENCFVSNQSTTSAGTDIATNDGGTDVKAKELVRYKFCTDFDQAGASTTEFAVIRALAPSWQVNR